MIDDLDKSAAGIGFENMKKNDEDRGDAAKSVEDLVVAFGWEIAGRFVHYRAIYHKIPCYRRIFSILLTKILVAVIIGEPATAQLKDCLNRRGERLVFVLKSLLKD